MFREAIASRIPSLIKLLEDKEEFIRQTTIELIGSLANHGERQLAGMVVQLI
jgi:hypothetical protein